ncbi:MAG: hypothetical protein DRO87_10070 [Candidatus Thorarchaeota archaeon]|nr:MAG: hypothetical protein DRO87_10070 [Candidatus Thorarchaeota archaeon]
MANDKVTMQDNVPLDIFGEATDIQRDVRVALYDETNLTTRPYSYGGFWTGNVTLVENLLVGAGFEVTRLTAGAIDGNDTLRTGLFDVFVMVDNNPRDYITDEVFNFWRSGGGILSFDGAINFLCYFGVMVPDSAGNHGHGVYWTYSWSQNQTVLNRHPVSQGYAVDDYITDDFDWAAFDWSALSGLSYASEYTPITYAEAGTNWVNTLARDTVFGGRVVQTFGDANPIAEGHGQMIIDAVNWLCPRPKARVVFDYSHRPYYGIDVGDPYLGYSAGDRYARWRDALVNRSYTVDKLYPSAEGNLTAENLAPYDALVIAAPKWIFSAAERSAVLEWVAQGGGLIVLGDILSFSDENSHINYLLYDLDLSLSGVGYSTSSIATAVRNIHPTSENVLNTRWEGGQYVNVTGDAYPLWYDGPNVLCAVQEYGLGRVFLAGDINALANYIDYEDNLQLAVNLVNWISSGAAPILLYVDEPHSVNYYRTPVTNALNEIGLNYEITTLGAYLNRSLVLKDWYLVIIDNPWWGLSSYYDDLDDYVDRGGRLLMSTYKVDSYPSSELWSTLGFGFAGEAPNQVPLYLWTSSSVFNIPHHYTAANFTPFEDYGDEGDMLTVFDNATAIAGFSDTPQDGNASIVLGNNGRTIYNGYLIDQFQGDLDDSTYADNYELWMNEIAYLLRVTIDEPSDIGYVEGATGNDILWHPHSIYPADYTIRRNGTIVQHGPWSGNAITFSVDGLDNGTYVFVISVNDRVGYSATDEVIVTVEAASTSTPVQPPTDPTMLIIIAAAAGVALVVILILWKKRS